MHTAIATTIIPMSTTPPTPPPIAGPKIGACVGVGVGVGVAIKQCAWAVSESTSVGQLGYTSILLPWTKIYTWSPLIHCWMYDSTWLQSGSPDRTARYKTTFLSLMQRNFAVLIWFTVNEHWHLELMADIMELEVSSSFSLVSSNCKICKHNPSKNYSITGIIKFYMHNI